MNYVEAVADAITKRFGIAINLTRPKGNYFTWNPKSRTITAARSDDLFPMMHEVSHYIAATKKERTYPEFGLGTDGDYGRKRTRMRMTDDARSFREEVTGCIHAYLGYWVWRELPEHRVAIENDFIPDLDRITEGDLDNQARRRLLQCGVTEAEWNLYWNDKEFYPALHDISYSRSNLTWSKSRIHALDRQLAEAVEEYGLELRRLRAAEARLRGLT